MLFNKCEPDSYKQNYDVLIAKLQEFSVIGNCGKFVFSTTMSTGKREHFTAALEKLSINCNFDTFLKTALRNQFVFGKKYKNSIETPRISKSNLR